MSSIALLVVSQIAVGTLTTVQTATAAVLGARPFVTILCRFADSTDTTPDRRVFFERLMGPTRPGLAHYWSEVSYGAVDLTGSTVVGWYNLPRAESHYLVERGGEPQYDYDTTLADCAAAADADVFFPAFAGINLVFNQPLCCANGAPMSLDLDGETRQYHVTWLPSSHYIDQAIVAHEMGHGFGLPHSSGPYGQLYDSGWDVMSGTGGPRCIPDPAFGCPGQHTIAYHKARLGWIRPRRRAVIDPGFSSTVVLDRLAQPVSTTSLLMVQIPIRGSPGKFYTVEYRRFAGYDASGPALEGVVIHRVDETFVPPPGDPGAPRARVVDDDGNGDANDEGAVWMPGETFHDTANRISVTVASLDDTGARIHVANDPTADLRITSIGAPPGSGTSGRRFTLGDVVKNIGGLPSAASETRYYLSLDPRRSPDDPRLIGIRDIPGLAPGEISRGDARLRIPSATPAGHYFVIACADDGAAVVESRETNNCRASSSTLRVVPAPDLRPVALTVAPAEVRPGQLIQIEERTKNIGSAGASASRTRYYLSLDGRRDGGDRNIGGRAVGALSAGQSSSSSNQLVIPRAAASGTYIVIACADDEDDVVEGNEANNCRAASTALVVTDD